MAQDTTGESALAGTQWELVTIQSMDDTANTPDDPSRYTLNFAEDGTVSLQSDCNRARGSWTSEGASQLRFGPLVATRALCPPPSLDEVYRAQFEWVRSYVMRDGHLFLATMADGSIIEFRPANVAITARLQGEDITSTDVDEVRALILTRLLEDYAQANGLTATDAEVDAHLSRMERDMRAEMGDAYEGTEGLTPEEMAEVNELREAMARDLIQSWKVNRALFAEYGGRVIYQQLGPEPLDAYREFLRSRQAAGEFELLESVIQEGFWPYFNNEQLHDFMTPDMAQKAFATAPWVSE